MSRSHRGNIKRDIEKLERQEAKLSRRFLQLNTAIGKTRQIIEVLKQAYNKTEEEKGA